MKRSDQAASRPEIILLFPRGDLGEKIASRFLALKYNLIVITQDAGTETLFMQRFASQQTHIRTVRFGITAEGQAEFQPSILQDLETVAGVFYFAGDDFLTLKSHESDKLWRQDSDETLSLKFSAVDLLLQYSHIMKPRLWINISIGMGATQKGEAVFCQTRYGMLGLQKAIELNPNLKGIQILNICLTYFRHAFKGKPLLHCSHCVTEQVRDGLIPLENENDLLDYLIAVSNKVIGKEDKG